MPGRGRFGASRLDVGLAGPPAGAQPSIMSSVGETKIAAGGLVVWSSGILGGTPVFCRLQPRKAIARSDVNDTEIVNSLPHRQFVSATPGTEAGTDRDRKFSGQAPAP